MKKNENKFHAECITHLLKIGASFERFASCAVKAHLHGAEFTFFDSDEDTKTNVYFVPCKNDDGVKQNFFSVYSRAESLELFKQHISSLFDGVEYFSYKGIQWNVLKEVGMFHDYTSAKDAMRQAKRQGLKNARLLVNLGANRDIYLT